MSYRADVIRYVLGDGRRELTAGEIADEALGVADASGASRQVLSMFTPRAVAANLIVLEGRGSVRRAGSVRDPRAGRPVPKWRAAVAWLDGVPQPPLGLSAELDATPDDETEFLRTFADDCAALLGEVRDKIDALIKRHRDRYAVLREPESSE